MKFIKRVQVLNRRSGIIGIICTLICTLLAATCSAELFFVAPDGSDAGAGTLEDPWVSLAGARDNVRQYLDGHGNVTVYVRGGTYTLTETETPGSGTILLRANLTADSTYSVHTLGEGYTNEGNIVNGAGGEVTFLDSYRQSFEAICPGNIAGASLPGAAGVQAVLASTISDLGGAAPACPPLTSGTNWRVGSGRRSVLEP